MQFSASSYLLQRKSLKYTFWLEQINMALFSKAMAVFSAFTLHV